MMIRNYFNLLLKNIKQVMPKIEIMILNLVLNLYNFLLYNMFFKHIILYFELEQKVYFDLQSFIYVFSLLSF